MDGKCTRERVTAKQPHLKRIWGSIPGLWNCSCQASPGCVLLLLLVWLYNTRTYTSFFYFSKLPRIETPATPLCSPLWLHSTGEANFLNTHISNRFAFFLETIKHSVIHRSGLTQEFIKVSVASRNGLLPECLKNHCFKSYWNLCTKDLK